MSDHSSALVPTECWSYANPSLRVDGNSMDIGLLCEALIYYDTVHVNFENPPQMAEFVRWLVHQGRLNDFLALLRDGSVQIYDYSFKTIAIQDQSRGLYSLYNIQDQTQEKQDTFEQRFLYDRSLEDVIPKARHRQKVYEAFRGRVLEAKASEFGRAIDSARADMLDLKRSAMIVQSFVDEVYRYRSLGPAPEISASITERKDIEGHDISWNIDFKELGLKAGKNLNFDLATPLRAAGHANRYLWSAAQTGCDLYVGAPMSGLIGDKLYESTGLIIKTATVIDQLQKEVEFPDIRSLVNQGMINFNEILLIRKKATKFRTWLQQEGARDRNAIYSYHLEVAREAGLKKGSRKILQIFGLIGGGALGSVIGNIVTGPAGGAFGGAAGAVLPYLTDIASKIGEGWKPIVFGEWLRTRIEKVILENKGQV